MLKKIFKIQFVRFLLVGFANTLFGYGIFSFLLWIGLHYSLAALFGTILGVIFNFKTTGTIVFDSHNNFLIVKFFGVYSVIYILNVICLYLFSLYQINAYIAGAILILPMAIVSFILNKKFVFTVLNKTNL